MLKFSLTMKQLVAAANTRRAVIDQWIANAHFAPKMTPEPGKPRLFSEAEAIQVAAMVRLVRTGIEVREARYLTSNLHFLRDSVTILAVWQGPAEIIPTSERDAPPLRQTMHPEGYPIIAAQGARFRGVRGFVYSAWLVRPSALASMVQDRDKEVIILVNLDEIAQDVSAAAQTPAE